MTDEAGNLQVVERFVAAWLAGDLDGVLACVADDVVYSPSGTGGVRTYHGRAAVGEAFADAVGADDEITLHPVVDAGDVVLGPWSYPTASDGSTLRGLDVYTLRDGKITSKDVYSKRTLAP